MSILGSVLRWIVRLLAYGLAIAVVLALAAIALVGYTSFGARIATDRVADILSNRDRVITIGNPQGLLTGCLCADMVTIADTKGIVATITDLKVDWSPMALFSRRFHATHLSAGLIDLRRKPVKTIPDRPTDGETGSSLSLPIAVRIDEISLPDIRLSEALAGSPFALSANGRASAEGQSINATLAANRQGMPYAKFAADLDYAAGEKRLDLRALVSEPKGGLIATLLKLPQTPAVSLDIRGAGPLSQWSGRLQASLDGQPRVTVEGQHVVTDDGLHHLQIKGGGTVDSVMPLAFRPLFTGQTNIDLSATFNDAGKIDIQTGNIATGSVVLAASGTLDPAGNNSLNANLLGTSGPVDLRLPLDDGEARLLISNVNLALTGPAKQAKLNATASIDSITAPQGTFEKLELTAHSDQFDLANRSGPVQLRVLAGEADFADPSLARAIQGPITLAVPLQLSRDRIGFNDTAISSGRINGKVSGAYVLSNSGITGGFNLFVAPAALPDVLAAKFDTTINAIGQISAQLPGKLNLSNLVLKSGTAEAIGSARIEDGALTADITGKILDLKKLLPTADGSLDFAAKATGPLTALGIDGTLKSADIRIAERHVTNFNAEITGTAAADAPQGTIKATGLIDGQQLDISGDVVSQNGTLSIPSLLAEIGANKLQGKIDLSPAFEPQGSLTFDLPDLGLLAALAGQTVKGDLKGSADIATVDGKTALALSATGNAIERDVLTITKPDVKLAIGDLKTLAITGTVNADQIVSGTNVIATPSLDFKQAGSRTDFDLKAQYDSAPLLASGNLTSANGQTSVQLETLSAKPQGIPLNLSFPTAISIRNGDVALNALKIDAGGGSLTINGTAGETLDLAIDIDRLPATLAEPFIPDVSVKGAISGTATIKGSLAPTGTLDIKADVHGSSSPLTLRVPKDGDMQFSISSATLSLNGSMQAAKLDAHVAIDEAAMPQGSFRKIALTASSDAFDLTARSGAVAAKVVIDEAAFANANLGKALKAPITLSAPLQIAPDTIRFDGTTIDSAYLKGSLVGVYALQAKSLNGNFRLIAQPAALPVAAAQKFDTPVTLEGRVAGTLPSTFNVTNLRLGSGTIEASGQASLENETLSAEISGRVLDLKKALENAAGTADFSVKASGTLSELSIDGNLRADGITMAGRKVEALEATITGTANPDAPQGTVKATGTIDGQPISINADVLSKDDKTSVPALLAEVGSNKVQGKLEFSQSFAPTGSLSFDLPDIGLLAALAAQKAEGDLKGSADITDDNGKIAVRILASGNGIKRDTLSIVKPNIDLTVTDLKALAANGNISADEIISGTNRIAGLAVKLDQSGSRTGYDVTATYDGAPLAAAGSVDSTNGQTVVRLDSFSASPRKTPVKLAAPTQIAIRQGSVGIDGLKITLGTGSITVNGAAGDSLKINAVVKDLPANLANSVMPSLAAEGLISGTIGVTGASAAPVVDFKTQWPNAAVAQTKSAGIGALSVTADGRFANNKVNVNTTVSGQNGLALKGGGDIATTPDGTVNLSFNGNLPFAVIASQLASSGFVLQGNAAFDVKVGGTTGAPLVTGKVTTSNGKFIDVRRNLAVNDLTATVTLNGQQAVISNASGHLASGGSVSASGTIGIQPGSNFPVDIAIKLDKATYVDGTLVVATTNGTLAIRGPLLANPVLSGALQMDKASITVPERLPRSLQEINVKHRHAPPAVLAQLRKTEPQKPSGKSSTLGLDLTLDAPSQIFVRGRGIDAELGGSVVIKGTAAAPIVSGGFTMRRGRMTILNRRLNFADNGKISFAGDLTPTLDMAASSASGSTTLTVDVSGLATDPAITFSSSPALPQDEVLAQLIFGQSMSKLSPVQIAQLADAVSQLAGGRSTSLFEGLRSNLGVDDFDVSTDEKGQTSVSVGRYLNDKTYFELQQGGSAGAKAVINLDVGRGIKLRAGAGGNGSGEAGIVYEHEY